MFWNKKRKPISVDQLGPDLPGIVLKGEVGAHVKSGNRVEVRLNIGKAHIQFETSGEVAARLPVGKELTFKLVS